VSETARYH